jgi:hypothetical protein
MLMVMLTQAGLGPYREALGLEPTVFENALVEPLGRVPVTP